jgi:hypothetical protein
VISRECTCERNTCRSSWCHLSVWRYSVVFSLVGGSDA